QPGNHTSDSTSQPPAPSNSATMRFGRYSVIRATPGRSPLGCANAASLVISTVVEKSHRLSADSSFPVGIGSARGTIHVRGRGFTASVSVCRGSGLGDAGNSGGGAGGAGSTSRVFHSPGIG